MTGSQIIAAVKQLDLPKGSYIVFGSGPMALAGIRQSADIDMLVTPELFESLKTQGWKTLVKAPGDEPLVFGDFEAHQNWDFSSYQPTLEQLLSSATYNEGVPFASLKEVRKWKESSGRSKDLLDIALINTYLLTK